MPSPFNDPAVRLAFSIYENRGIYALLIGSGLSRAAEVPTGWKITIDLIRRIAMAQGEKEQVDWVSWYRTTTGNEPDYSTLLGQLGSSSEERRSILESYIEPSDEDREAGRKISTAAHYAIADLVSAGYVRVIITTNFDRLIENALRERGVEPTVISSEDALEGAELITHAGCFLFKMHGDYKDIRVRNTDAELSGYPDKYNELLDRIFDEYGLIVCGWSGEWDHALRAAILRNPARRYSMFWATRSEPSDSAAALIAHRNALVVSIPDADSFFTQLHNNVETLAQTHRENPQSIELLVNSTKRHLSRPEHQIQLDELLDSKTESLLEKLDSSELSMPGDWSGEEFNRRIATYEAATEPLARMVGVLGRWGNDSEFTNLIEIVRSVYFRTGQARGGLPVWLDLHTYPAVLLVTAYGIGLVRSKRWATLHRLLSEPIKSNDSGESERVVKSLFLWSWKGGRDDYWRNLEGFDRLKTPLSNHLCELFTEWSKSFVGTIPDFEELYETWEIMGSFAFSEGYTLDTIRDAMASENARGHVWVPVGRSGWNDSTRKRILNLIQQNSLKQEILEAGFAHKQSDLLEAIIDNFLKIADRIKWSY